MNGQMQSAWPLALDDLASAFSSRPAVGILSGRLTCLAARRLARRFVGCRRDAQFGRAAMPNTRSPGVQIFPPDLGGRDFWRIERNDVGTGHRRPRLRRRRGRGRPLGDAATMSMLRDEATSTVTLCGGSAEPDDDHLAATVHASAVRQVLVDADLGEP
jgi:hypothetical protein